MILLQKRIHYNIVHRQLIITMHIPNIVVNDERGQKVLL